MARALPHSWWVGPQARPPAGPTLVAPRRCHVHRGCRRDLQRWRPNPLVVVCARALQRRGRTTRDPAGTLLASDALGARGGGPRQRDQWKPSARRGRRWASPAGRQAGLALHQPGPHTPRGGVPWLPCLLDGRAADSRHAVVARELAVAAGQRETDFVGHFQLEPQSSPRGALLQRWVLRGCGRARNGTGWPATRRGDYLSWSRENGPATAVAGGRQQAKASLEAQRACTVWFEARNLQARLALAVGARQPASAGCQAGRATGPAGSLLSPAPPCVERGARIGKSVDSGTAAAHASWQNQKLWVEFLWSSGGGGGALRGGGPNRASAVVSKTGHDQKGGGGSRPAGVPSQFLAGSGAAYWTGTPSGHGSQILFSACEHLPADEYCWVHRSGCTSTSPQDIIMDSFSSRSRCSRLFQPIGAHHAEAYWTHSRVVVMENDCTRLSGLKLARSRGTLNIH